MLLTVSELLIFIAMVYSEDINHMESIQLFCDAGRMEWDLSDKLQPSEPTFNFHPPGFLFLVALQVLIEIFANGNPHCIVFESSITITE